MVNVRMQSQGPKRIMIWRSPAVLSLLLLLWAPAAPTAIAAGDSASSVLADCGAPDLAASVVDSCLERARVLDETDPSPQLESLEAALEARAGKGQPAPPGQPADAQASGPPAELVAPDAENPVADSGTASADAGPQSGTVEAERELPTSQAPVASPAPEDASPQADQPPPGIDDDQPPIADPPDSDASPAPDDPQ
jgi:hypothetical protein